LRAGLYKKSIISLTFLIGIFIIGIYSQSYGKTAEDPASLRDQSAVYFIAYGKLIRINYISGSISTVGVFHRTAKYYAVSMNGAVWSRLDYMHIGGIYPGAAGAGGRKSRSTAGSADRKEDASAADGEDATSAESAAASIRLPFRPYRITVLPDGTGYISHQILTSKGFPLSVVDTQKMKFLHVIYHIEGIVTDLVNTHEIVYLSTYGFRKPHALRIYRIKKNDLKAEEIFRSESTGYVLKLATFKNTLYVTLLPGKTVTIEPEMKLIDLSGKVIADFDRKRMGRISVILDKPYFYGEQGYLPCKTEKGSEGFAVFSVKKQSVVDILPVQSSIYKIIGIQNGTIAYINIQPDVGKGELVLYFYSIKGRKEVMHIKILPAIRRTAENKK